MNMSLLQIIAAIFMVTAAIALVVSFRKAKRAASERRMLRMLERIGLDPAIASSGDNESIMKEIRRRCRTCATEDLCERWLAGDVHGDNYFCPNSSVIVALQRTSGAVG
jgi:hypothetical protein